MTIKYALSVWIIAIFAGLPALATDGSGGIGFYEMVFGDPDQRNLSRSSADGTNVADEPCDTYGGVLGGINSFFCHMEKDMGIRGVGSTTKTFGTMVIHAEIVLSSVTISGVTYDHQAEVWVCDSSSLDCTQTANFSRFDYVAFSFDKASGVNKGYAESSPNGLPGGQTGASQITYDVGSGTANQSISAKLNFSDGSNTYDMRVLAYKSSTGFQVNVVGYGASAGFRFAMSGAPPSMSGGTNYYNMYFEATGGSGTSGFYTLEAAGLAAPATNHGMCILASESGSSTGVASGGSNCSSYAFAAFDTYSASGSPNAQSFTVNGILGTWQGMAAHLSAI